jgi:hypothetical protein
MEERAREARNAAGGDGHRVAGVVSEIADEIVRLLVVNVFDDLARPGSREREQ